MFYTVIVLFFSTRGPWADLCEILPIVQKYVQFINAWHCPSKNLVVCLQKNFGDKNMLNLAWFGTLSHSEHGTIFCGGYRPFKMKFEISGQTPANIWQKKKQLHMLRISILLLIFLNQGFKAEILYVERKVFQEAKVFRTIFWQSNVLGAITSPPCYYVAVSNYVLMI